MTLTKLQYIELLIDIAETDGNFEPRVKALEVAGMWVAHHPINSPRLGNVRERVATLLREFATDPSVPLQERLHAARLLGEFVC